MPRPLSTYERYLVAVPTAVASLLGFTACGTAIRAHVFPNLECEEKTTTATQTATYSGLGQDNRILIGHANSDPDVYGDPIITVAANGRVNVSEGDNPYGAKPQIQTQANGDIEVATGDERYMITAEREAGATTITVSGQCAPPAPDDPK